MQVGQKVTVTKYLRDKDRKIVTEKVPGVIVSALRYDKNGVPWHWCSFK